MYFTVAWVNDGDFSGFSVVVCAWSTTRNLRGQLASVGLAQAHPNNMYILWLLHIMHSVCTGHVTRKMIIHLTKTSTNRLFYQTWSMYTMYDIV